MTNPFGELHRPSPVERPSALAATEGQAPRMRIPAMPVRGGERRRPVSHTAVQNEQGAAIADLPYGFTLALLNRVAGASARGSMWGYPPNAEKFDLARYAILEHLYTCVDRVDVRADVDGCNLLTIGQAAIRQHLRQLGALQGIAVGREGYTTGDQLVRHRVYWTSTATPTSSPEEPVVDTVALRQIWPLLAPMYRRALRALAEHYNHDDAAKAVGLTYDSLVTYVHYGRKTFLRWWHQHERPSGVWGSDQRRRRDGKSNVTRPTIRNRQQVRRHRQRRSAGEIAPTISPRVSAAAPEVPVTTRSEGSP